ncbi:hypothetical protein L7F22_003384 [Adiantum nelumboides]|nr:hypothetical protein [Adiantum nelumboides]
MGLSMSGDDGLHDSASLSSLSPRSSPLSSSVPLFSTSAASIPELSAWPRLEAKDKVKLGSSSGLNPISVPYSRDDSAMPRFPGPLLPTVRRLKSSPASSKAGASSEIGLGHAKLFDVHSKSKPIAITSCSNHGFAIRSDSSMQEKDASNAKHRFEKRDDFEPSTPNNQPADAILWPWRHRSRSNNVGSDFVSMPPAKSQRITESHNTVKDSVANKTSEHFSLSSEWPSRKVSGNGSAAGWRRRKLPESASARQLTDALSNIRPPPCTSSTAKCSFTTRPVPSKQASFLHVSVSQSRSDSKILAIFAIFVLAMLVVLKHHQGMLLKQENTMLKAASCQGLEPGIGWPYHVDASSNKAAWKSFITGGLILLLCGLYFTRNHLATFYSKRKLPCKSTIDEAVPISKRVAYLVDVLFSTHPYAKAIALLFATLLLIGFGGCSLYVVGDEDLSDALWRSWTYVADSGNHADSVGMGPRIVSVSISIGGMLIFALMLGLVSDAISEKVDSLRKGKSEVIETGHTLILGWSDKLGSLLKQLAIANQSLGGSVVVVLAERDKEEMELEIAKLEFDLLGTSVICRSGSPLIMADLKKVSVSKARAIIVLAEVENADQSDARALRVVLSLTAVKEGLRGHIVVELSDLDNEPLVKLVGGDIVETVVAHDVIGRLMIQCARQPGLAQIWEDILGFDKAEFYLKRWPQLDGVPFNDILVSFLDAIPCGVKAAGDKGRIILNPDDDYVLREGDEILVIAEDDDTYAPASPSKLLCGSLPRVIVPPKLPERILFCGWRRDIHDMIKILDAFLPSGSELWIFSDVGLEEREKKLQDENLDRLDNIKLEHRQGNPVIRRHLESLPLQTFDSILILADEKLEENVVIADSRSLATLLLIRDIQSKRLPISFSKVTQSRRPGFIQGAWIGEMQQASDKSIIISEILDSRTKHLVSVSKIGDYVLSNELVSMALAMVAEEKQINRVLEELFAEEGNELHIRSAEYYLYDKEQLSFFQIMLRARQRNEIVVGYRRSSQDRAIINPPNKAKPQKWSTADVFIILG